MAQAIRVISVERGEDPQQYVLLSYGGAGGLHAVELAREVGIPQVIIPPYASVFSAYGMLCADTIKDYSQTVMLSGDTSFVDIDHRFSPLIKNAKRDMAAENVSPEKRSILQYLDVRYAGQSFEITVPYSTSFEDNFHHSHAQLYGYARRDAPIEIVNLRVKAITQTRAPVHSRAGTSSLSNAHLGNYPVYLEKNSQYSAGLTPTLIPFYRPDQLAEGTEFWGPAVLVRKDTTILIPQHDKLSIDEFGNIFINLEL
jgi:N-methylhydantoinase A